MLAKEVDKQVENFSLKIRGSRTELVNLKLKKQDVQIVVVVPDTGALNAWSSALSVWDYNYFVVCCHPDPLLHPRDTTTPLLPTLG